MARRNENYAGPILSIRWIRVVVTVALFLQVLLSYLWVALVRRGNNKALAKAHYKNAERVYRAFILLKGVYIKAGQFLSTQVAVLPPPYLVAMARMQDRVPKAHNDAIIRRLEEHFQKPISEVFQRFDIEPLATASIGQVHRAQLHDGRDVVVKVRYPGIVKFFMSDLKVIELLVPIFVTILEWAFEGGLSGVDHRGNISELVHYLREELDYENERRNHERMIEVVSDFPDDGIKVPAIYPELCGSAVIVMEYVEAVNLGTWFLRKDIDDETKNKVYATLFKVSVHGILRHGYFQADPHPGNYMVTPDHKVVLIDFGCTQQLPEQFHRGILKIIGGFLSNNPRQTAEALFELGFRTRQHTVESLQVWTEYGFAIIREVLGHFERGDSFIEHLQDNVMKYAAEALKLRDEHRLAAVPKTYVMLGRALATPPVPYNRFQPKLNLQEIVMPYVFDLTVRNQQATSGTTDTAIAAAPEA